MKIRTPSPPSQKVPLPENARCCVTSPKSCSAGDGGGGFLNVDMFSVGQN